MFQNNTFSNKPKTINYQINDNCNSHCIMCNVWRQHRSKELSIIEFQNLLSDPFFSEVEHVGITGGEPTLREDLLDFYSLLPGILPSFTGASFITNGFLTERAVSYYTQINSSFKTHGLIFSGMVSLDGIGSVHDSVRRTPGAFYKATNTLFHLLQNDVPTIACCTIVKENVFHLHDLLNWGKLNNIYIRFRIGEFINRLYNAELSNQIRNFDIYETRHLISFYHLLLKEYETDDTIKKTYTSILSLLSGGERLIRCPYQTLDAINIDSSGQFEYCSPKGTPHQITKPLERSILQNLDEQMEIQRQFCRNCIHDYHSDWTEKISWQKQVDQQYDASLYTIDHNISSEEEIPDKTIDLTTIDQLLLVGWYGTETAGDIAILSGIVQEYLLLNPVLSFIVLSFNPYYTRTTLSDWPQEILSRISIVDYHGVDAYEAIQKCDGVVMAGGPLMDIPETGMIACIFKLFSDQKKPTIIEGCGIGPLNNEQFKENVISLARMATRISVRDSNSEKQLRNFGIRKRIEIRSDPSTTFIRNLNIQVSEGSGKVIRCFFRELTSEYPQSISISEASENITSFLRHLVSWYPDFQIELWSMHYFPVGNDDRQFEKKIVETIHHPNLISIERPQSPQEILQAMKDASFVVSMRFHSVVFASEMKVPFIAIDYTAGGKIKGFLDDTHQSNRMTPLPEIGNLSRIELEDRLNNQPSQKRNENPRLHVVQINRDDSSGGAARAAYRLHQALNRSGTQSTYVVKKKFSGDRNVIQVSPSDPQSADEMEIFSGIIQENGINQGRTEISNSLYSWPLLGYDLSKIQAIQNADVLNLHWISYYQSIETLSQINKLNIPIVWTIHDCWAFTGGCHYTSGCTQFQEQCINCPQLSMELRPYAKKIFLEKQILFHLFKPTIVSPSQWLGEKARSSSLFRDFRIEVIPNAVDTDVFHPIPKIEARRRLSLPLDGIFLLFGADDGNEIRKGFSDLFQAVKYCLTKEEISQLPAHQKPHILCFGTANQRIQSLNLPNTAIGRIDSEEKLSLVYSAADLCILPSLEDNLPNIMIEAMSCGTPVLAYQTGGIVDVIEDQVNGALVPVNDYMGLGESIVHFLQNPDQLNAMGRNAREKAVAKYSLSVQAENYKKLYNSLLTSPTQPAPITNISQAKNNSEDNQAAVSLMEIINDTQQPSILFHALKAHVTQAVREKYQKQDRLASANAEEIPQVHFDDGIFLDELGTQWINTHGTMTITRDPTAGEEIISFNLKPDNPALYSTFPFSANIFIDDELYKTIWFEDERLDVPVTLYIYSGESDLKIQIETDQYYVPYRLGVSQDHRHRSLILSNLKIQKSLTSFGSYTPDDFIIAADDAAGSGDIQKAIYLLNQCRKYYPDVLLVHQLLAILYVQVELFAQAEEMLWKACAIEPDNGDLYNQLGTVLYLQNNYAESIVAYRHALKVSPSHAEARKNLRMAEKSLKTAKR